MLAEKIQDQNKRDWKERNEKQRDGYKTDEKEQDVNAWDWNQGDESERNWNERDGTGGVERWNGQDGMKRNLETEWNRAVCDRVEGEIP